MFPNIDTSIIDFFSKLSLYIIKCNPECKLSIKKKNILLSCPRIIQNIAKDFLSFKKISKWQIFWIYKNITNYDDICYYINKNEILLSFYDYLCNYDINTLNSIFLERKEMDRCNVQNFPDFSNILSQDSHSPPSPSSSSPTSSSSSVSYSPSVSPSHVNKINEVNHNMVDKYLKMYIDVKNMSLEELDNYLYINNINVDELINNINSIIRILKKTSTLWEEKALILTELKVKINLLVQYYIDLFDEYDIIDPDTLSEEDDEFSLINEEDVISGPTILQLTSEEDESDDEWVQLFGKRRRSKRRY